MFALTVYCLSGFICLGFVLSNEECRFTGLNVARNKDTYQHPGTAHGGVSSRAVDGGRSADYSQSSCTHTTAAYRAPAYWNVDLVEKYTIEGIRIYNRNSAQVRLANFQIIGYPSTTTLYDDRLVQNKLYMQPIISIPLYSEFNFSSITIKIPAHPYRPDRGHSILTLCEVEIYAVTYVCPTNVFEDQPRWNIVQGTGFVNYDRDFVSCGTIIAFTCSSNSALVGSANLMCLLDGRYNANVPTCMPYVCPVTTSDAQLEWNVKQETGTLNNDGLVSSGAIIEFACEQNYNLVGVASVTCLKDGTYDASIPRCNETRCIRPSDVIYGQYEQALEESYAVGAIVTWTCFHGYKSNSLTSRQCTETSMWSGADPECMLITCSYPTELSNVILTFDNDTTYNSGEVASNTYVKVKCATGFETNVTRIECSLQEEWNTLPTCLQITCEHLGDFDGGQYLYNTSDIIADQSYERKYPYGTEATPKCNTLYRLTRGLQRFCDESGNWTIDVAICAPLCEVVLLLNGYYIDQHNKTLSENDTALYITPMCNNGYEIEPRTETVNDMMTCLANHTWDGEPDNCRPVCVLPLLLNGYYKDQQNNTLYVNETAHHVIPVCEANYKIEEREEVVNTTMTCLGNHTWEGEPAKCVSVGGQTSDKQTSVVPAAAGGGVAAAIGVMAVVGVVVFILTRRRNNRKDHPETAEAYNNPVRPRDLESVTEDIMYAVCPEEKVVEDNQGTYYNVGDNPKQPKRAINVADLAEVVFSPDSISRFSKEFETFPEGMTQPHQHAIKNRRLNRYKNLYAYDESRVILDIWNVNSETDYINACYIHEIRSCWGFRKPKAFIASQGPTIDNVFDFWRMIWQTNSDKIVMLTNLFEDSKMKCIRYWPEETDMYGEIEVRLDSIETFSNFVIRTLLMTKTGEPQRRVQQFHFTTWPDKDVPYFSSSLVHFRNKVKAVNSVYDGPVVVHCSAGVGRTGTFIAIDFLTDQANALGYVDVAVCVDELRRQRVDMVQKEKQYVFVHQALVEILILETSVVPTSSFDKSYRNLLDPGQGGRKLDAEFELLWKFSSKTVFQETDNQDANIYTNLQAAEEYMPSLSKAGRKLRGEYIDATFLPMYKEDSGMIITLTPLNDSIEDFWKLVYHQNVHTIVMMDDVTEQNLYWPKVKQSATYGDITIHNDGAEKKRHHNVLQMKLISNGKERAIQLLQFGRWATGNLLPDTPRDIISAIDLVETNQSNAGNCPIVVHCSDGRERSGLYCVIAATLDRTKIEQDVAISQVIQEMRHRRGNVIPNVEQFQLCHEVVQQFLQQFETYSNFAFKK